MNILSIFYAEFDIHTGPELLYQYPKNAVSKDEFKKISFFVIPNNNLCGKLNILKLENDLIVGNTRSWEELSFDSKNTHDHKNSSETQYMISLPINVENPNKYKRGSFEFNFCIILLQSQFTPENRDLL